MRSSTAVMAPRAASMNRALVVVTSRTSLPTPSMSWMVDSTVWPRPVNVADTSSRSVTNSPALVDICTRLPPRNRFTN